jgi:hypothetical protein
MFASCDTSGQITYHTLDDAMPGRQIVAATHNSRQVSYLARQFIELVKQENAELVRS